MTRGTLSSRVEYILINTSRLENIHYKNEKHLYMPIQILIGGLKFSQKLVG